MFKRNIRSLAPELFRKTTSKQHISDAEYARMRRQLQSTLAIPAENRWIADWLFSDREHTFHKNMCLSPDSFQHAYAMRMSHEFMTPAASPHAARPAHPPSDDGLIVVPVANLDQCTVGYAFLHGSSTIEGSIPFCGRFAFDHSKKEFLVVIHAVPIHVDDNINAIMLLMHMKWADDNFREHCLLACPDHDYSFYNLPNQVVTMCQTLSKPFTPADKLSDIDFLDAFLQEAAMDTSDLTDLLQNNKLNLQSITAETADSNPAEYALALSSESQLVDQMTSDVTSFMPWIVSDNGQTSDGLEISHHPVSTSISSGSFDLSSMTDALSGIETAIRGEFQGVKKAQKFIHPETGNLYEGFSGRILAKFEPANASLTSNLKDLATKLYFNSMIALSTDGPLLPTIHDAPQVEHLSADEMQESLRPDSDMTIAALGPIGGSERLGVARRTTSNLVNRMLSKEEKKEEKKRRNRLSAARSNERRRVELEWKKQTLIELRQRVVELELRKKTLNLENQVLKSQISIRNSIIF